MRTGSTAQDLVGRTTLQDMAAFLCMPNFPCRSVKDLLSKGAQFLVQLKASLSRSGTCRGGT